MGAVMIPEFLLVGQIVKREEAACILLLNQHPSNYEEEKTIKFPTSPAAATHKPSLCTLNEEEEEEEEAEEEEPPHTSSSRCGLSLFNFLLRHWLSFICPSSAW